MVAICLPFGVFYIRQHFIGARFGWDITKPKEKEGKRLRRRRGWSELEKYVCMLYMCVGWCESVYVSVCLLTAGGETSHLLDIRPVESLQCISPLPGQNVNTHNANPLTHMEIYIIPMRLVYLPIQPSVLPFSLSLLPSSSFFLCFWPSVL